MRYKDYYQILGTHRKASAEELKQAYRRLARRYHPDVSKEHNAEERFKEINEAYEVLKDKEKRKAYDQLGTHWREGDTFKPPPNWPNGRPPTKTNNSLESSYFSDFFESLFGFAKRNTAAKEEIKPASVETKTNDRHLIIYIGLEDSYQATTQLVEMTVANDDGSQTLKKLKVKIPKGIIEGQHIRLAGQSFIRNNRGQNGDLYLEVKFKHHKLFRLKEKDIYVNFPVAPWELALGTKVNVPTLGGNVEINLPVGAQTGQKLRLKGRGLGNEPVGDQYLVLQVVVPTPNSPQTKYLYERMSRELDFDPRAKFRE